MSPGVAFSSAAVEGANMEGTALDHRHPGTGNTQQPWDTVDGPCGEFHCAGPMSAAGAAALPPRWGPHGVQAACAILKPVSVDPEASESDLLRM